jgi:hypothetical protein
MDGTGIWLTCKCSGNVASKKKLRLRGGMYEGKLAVVEEVVNSQADNATGLYEKVIGTVAQGADPASIFPQCIIRIVPESSSSGKRVSSLSNPTASSAKAATSFLQAQAHKHGNNAAIQRVKKAANALIDNHLKMNGNKRGKQPQQGGAVPASQRRREQKLKQDKLHSDLESRGVPIAQRVRIVNAAAAAARRAEKARGGGGGRGRGGAGGPGGPGGGGGGGGSKGEWRPPGQWNNNHTDDGFEEGAQVLVKRRDKQEGLGTVRRDNGDHTFCVEFQDGEVDKGVPKHCMEVQQYVFVVGAKVEVLKKGAARNARARKGKIVRDNGNHTYQVQMQPDFTPGIAILHTLHTLHTLHAPHTPQSPQPPHSSHLYMISRSGSSCS